MGKTSVQLVGEFLQNNIILLTILLVNNIFKL